MSDLDSLTEELMQDPEFKKEYDALEPEFRRKQAELNARIKGEDTDDKE